ncbi:outer membrane protein transport protein [Sulfurimonas sp. MAG313]|nr:outer membrane protein transport protein [Sulfurimonas sp. MAG313]MDF1880376.1 outer membrane protein transport protein [Sulfurimonas sp. MAG313]
MTKSIKLALVAAMAMGATSAFATNGDNLIGTGTNSRAMGGVGIAKSFGAESGLANPALISTVKDMEVAGSATFFMPSVSFQSDAMSNANPGLPAPISADSAADFSVIPEISFAQRINDNIVYGVSVTGTAGMGVDYGDVGFAPQGGASDNGAFKMKTALQLLKVAVPFSYSKGGFSIGVAPILQYGTLEMSHMIGNPNATGPADAFILLDEGVGSDTSLGYEVGFSATNDGFTFGLVYKSELRMNYANTISSSINAFGGAAATGVASGDNLDQPAEFGMGLAYEVSGSTISLDYKNMAWGEAAGYADFGWENQDIFALGYEYAGSNWAVRAGYNYAKSPIVEQKASSPQAAYGAAVRNFFNLAGFPGIVESHYTAGGSYSVSDSLSLDTAVVYAAEVTESFSTAGMTQGFIAQGGGTPTGAETSSADVTHSQIAVTVGVTYKF